MKNNQGKEGVNELFEYFDKVSLAEAKGKASVIEVLKVGKIADRGIEITEAMLEDFVKNFNEGAYGTEVQVNLGHDRAGEAAGWIKKLIKEGGRLFAEVEWTPLGVEKIENKQFKFTSSELAFSHTHPETGKKIKNVLIGVALTNIPAVKGMNPVTLSEQAQNYILTTNNMKELENKVESQEEEVKAFDENEGVTEEAAEAAEVEEEVAEEAAEEEAEVVEEEAAEEEAELSEKKLEGYVELSEFQKLEQENAQLKAQVQFAELCEELQETMVLSESVKVGFISEDIEGVAKFMANLSDEQKGEFKAIISKVHNVDLSTIGSSASGVKKEVKSHEDAIVELAEEKMLKAKEAGLTLGVEEAQKLAAAELSEKQ